MYKYSVDEETSGRVQALADKDEKEQGVQDLIKRIQDYNQKFEGVADIPQTNVDFARLDDVVIDDDAIKDQATNELAEYKDASIKKIKGDTESNISKLEDDKESATRNYSTAMDNAKSYYEEAKENASQDALRRGLARSSIVINIMDAFDQAQLNRYNQLNDELTSNINNIDTKISGLKAQQDEALSEFDITYAVKLQDKINSLTKDLMNQQQQVLKYNNEIAAKEADYNKKYVELQNELNKSNWDIEKDLMDYAGRYGVNMIQKYKDAQIYSLAEKYFDSIDKDYTIDQLNNNDSLRKLLGKENISKLMQKYTK